MRLVPQLAFAGAVFLGATTSASAVTYSDSFTIDPLNFNCAFYPSTLADICGSFSFFGGPRMLNAGDQVTENINYTSPVFVQGSAIQNVLYVSVFDGLATGGPAMPGSNASTTNSSLAGYVGPASPFVGPYTNSFLHSYIAPAGFFARANDGFSIAGISSTFQILASDPVPVYGVGYGYSIAFPQMPKALFHFPGGTIAHPVNLPGLVNGTESLIPSAIPSQTFYAFYWKGGFFEGDGSSPEVASKLELIDLKTGKLLDEEILADGNGKTIKAILPRGVYEFGLASSGPGVPFPIPPVTEAFVNFLTPVTGVVPEPATIAVLGAAGIAGLGAFRRRVKSA